MESLISFVMPQRNRDDIIKDCIDSIIKQTIDQWELVVVDDHSAQDDRTEEIIKSYNDERIKYFVLDDENGIGISAARNFGNMIASSKIIAVTDSDDICLPQRAELTIKRFEDQECDIVYGRINHWWPETGKVEPRTNEWKEREFNFEYFKKFDFIPHPTSAYKKEVAINNPYNSFFRVAEDYDLFARLYDRGYKFSFIDEALVNYRKHEGSVSRQPNFKFNYTEMVQKNHGWK